MNHCIKNAYIFIFSNSDVAVKAELEIQILATFLTLTKYGINYSLKRSLFRAQWEKPWKSSDQLQIFLSPFILYYTDVPCCSGDNEKKPGV